MVNFNKPRHAFTGSSQAGVELWGRRNIAGQRFTLYRFGHNDLTGTAVGTADVPFSGRHRKMPTVSLVKALY